MHIRSLQITQFRNYENITLAFDPVLNLFWGANGQGKTNLLEALFYLTMGKSHRHSPDHDLVRFDDDYFRLEGLITTRHHGDIRVELFFSKKQGKVARMNGNRLERFSELMQVLSAVELSPEDIELTKGSPSVRRHFLDVVLSQTNVKYLQAWQEYRRVLNQRNELLRQAPPVAQSMFDVWDEQLVKWGSRLVWQRVQFVHELETIVNNLYHSLSDEVKEIGLSYDSLGFSAGDDPGVVESVFREQLAANFTRDQKYRVTQIGPHRDDLDIQFDRLTLRRFGSQGQHRLVSTALRLSQAFYLKQVNNDCPMVLFDDVFAELDNRHKQLLVDMMAQFDQVFIATPRHDDLHRLHRPAKVFQIHNGTAQVENNEE